MKLSTCLAAVALALAVAAPAAAVTYAATLSGANETVPNATTATGSGTLEVSNDENSINVNLSWAGLVAPANGAHVHCCALPGANGPIAIDFEPAAVITGSVALSFDLTLLSTYRTAFVTANGGTAASARTAFLNGLSSGRAYYNVHNAVFPAGQIRGQLAVVPEPASWAMLIGGFGLVGGSLRQRRAVVAA